MTPDDLARIHRDGTPHGRPWSADEIARLAASPGAFLLAETGGFALGRVAADEVELIFIGVAKGARRGGIGRKLLAGFEHEAAQRGAVRAFLEVAEDNAPAIALYRGQGWQQLARRDGYYARENGPAIAALIMEKALVAT